MTLGYLVLQRIPAPRTEHGWTYETIGAICADPNRVIDPFAEREVIDGEKWYTASLMTNGLWFVVNHQGRAINQGTAVHRRVVATLPADGR